MRAGMSSRIYLKILIRMILIQSSTFLRHIDTKRKSKNDSIKLRISNNSQMIDLLKKMSQTKANSIKNETMRANSERVFLLLMDNHIAY